MYRWNGVERSSGIWLSLEKVFHKNFLITPGPSNIKKKMKKVKTREKNVIFCLVVVTFSFRQDDVAEGYFIFGTKFLKISNTQIYYSRLFFVFFFIFSDILLFLIFFGNFWYFLIILFLYETRWKYFLGTYFFQDYLLGSVRAKNMD